MHPDRIRICQFIHAPWTLALKRKGEREKICRLGVSKLNENIPIFSDREPITFTLMSSTPDIV